MFHHRFWFSLFLVLSNFRQYPSEVATSPSCNPSWRSLTWSEQTGTGPHQHWTTSAPKLAGTWWGMWSISCAPWDSTPTGTTRSEGVQTSRNTCGHQLTLYHSLLIFASFCVRPGVPSSRLQTGSKFQSHFCLHYCCGLFRTSMSQNDYKTYKKTSGFYGSITIPGSYLCDNQPASRFERQFLASYRSVKLEADGWLGFSVDPVVLTPSYAQNWLYKTLYIVDRINFAALPLFIGLFSIR